MSKNNASESYTGTIDGFLEHCSKLDTNEVEQQIKREEKEECLNIIMTDCECSLEEAEDINLSLTGIWLRCNDKINRLKNMLKRKGHNYVQNEPMIDSFIDISNYGIIAQLVMKGKWKK